MNPPPKQLRAIITGASSGIGKATALAFAKSGIGVALIGRRGDRLSEVASLILDLGVEAKFYILDLSQVSLVKEKIASIVEDFGGVDILVNNAGMGYTKSISETSLTDWQQVIDLNLTSIFQCIHGVLPCMREKYRDRKNEKATIINVSSIAANNAFPQWGAYSVSKAGLVALSKTLAIEERSHNIRVAIVSPGAVNTGIWDTDKVQADFDRSAMLTPEIVAGSILYTALLPSEAVIEEVTVMPSGGAL